MFLPDLGALCGITSSIFGIPASNQSQLNQLHNQQHYNLSNSAGAYIPVPGSFQPIASPYQVSMPQGWHSAGFNINGDKTVISLNYTLYIKDAPTKNYAILIQGKNEDGTIFPMFGITMDGKIEVSDKLSADETGLEVIKAMDNLLKMATGNAFDLLKTGEKVIVK